MRRGFPQVAYWPFEIEYCTYIRDEVLPSSVPDSNINIKSFSLILFHMEHNLQTELLQNITHMRHVENIY